MKPIRILQVVTIMNRGGLETMLMNYYRKIDRNKIQFDFVTHRQERGNYDDEIEKLGGKIYRMPAIKPGNYRRYFKELDKFFKVHKDYKIVHSHINENSGFILDRAKKSGIQCRIAHSHLADLKFDYKFIFRIYARTYLKDSASEYFACSKNAGEWLFKRQICNGEKINILNNAIDTDMFKFNEDKRSAIKKKLNLENNFVIGHVGRFEKQKNHNFIIDVFNEIHKKNENAVLLLIGEGSLKKEIESKVKELNLYKAVRFMGVRSDIADIMQAMDIFLFPSVFEGLPVVLVEAQAAGIKCITSNSITKDVDISGNVKFIDLNMPASKWAEVILNTNINKKDMKSIIIESGYDASTNIRLLENFYLDKYFKALNTNEKIEA